MMILLKVFLLLLHSCLCIQTSKIHSNSLLIIMSFLLNTYCNVNLVSYKYIALCTFCVTLFYVPYCTFRRSFKEKCPLSGAKTQVKYVNLACFYYVDIGTYSDGSEFKYQGTVAKS